MCQSGFSDKEQAREKLFLRNPTSPGCMVSMAVGHGGGENTCSFRKRMQCELVERGLVITVSLLLLG